MGSYYRYRILSALVSRAPLPLCYALARLAGLAMSFLPLRRTRAVRGNLATVHGSDSRDPRVRRDARRALQYGLLNYMDLLHMGSADTAERVRRIPAPRIDLIHDAVARGKGLVLVSAHLGNFDLVVQKLALANYRVLIPVEPLEPPALRRYIQGQRGALGLTVEPIGPDTFYHMTACIRAGGIVVIVSDRDVQGTGQLVSFFGRRISLPNAAVLLALRTGAPVLGAFGYRHGDNSISASVVPMPLFAVPPGARGMRAAIESGMQALAGALETAILRDPGQWIVQQDAFVAPSSSPMSDEGAQRASRSVGIARRAVVPRGAPALQGIRSGERRA